MRWSLALVIPLLAAGTALAQQHEMRNYPMSVPAWDERTDSYLGCAGNELIGYAVASEWAGEIQVAFELPAPPKGGPWLIEYVAFFVSGHGTHNVTLRQLQTRDGAPGTIIAEDLTFTPVYAAWPPAEWTYVPLRDSAAYPAQLPSAEGGLICVGFELQADDAVGLASNEAGTHGWSYLNGSWIDDNQFGVTAAVRIGLTDLGLSQVNMSTWGGIKDLFGR